VDRSWNGHAGIHSFQLDSPLENRLTEAAVRLAAATDLIAIEKDKSTENIEREVSDLAIQSTVDRLRWIDQLRRLWHKYTGAKAIHMLTYSAEESPAGITTDTSICIWLLLPSAPSFHRETVEVVGEFYGAWILFLDLGFSLVFLS